SPSIYPYPNPANDLLNLPAVGAAQRTIMVYGIDGKNQIMSLSGSGPNKQLDTSSLPDGLYFFRAGMVLGKFVVKH
ncbi:MAG: T9SS type A sorting domain-containing protein, partial [Bacteroidota bacterium]